MVSPLRSGTFFEGVRWDLMDAQVVYLVRTPLPNSVGQDTVVKETMVVSSPAFLDGRVAVHDESFCGDGKSNGRCKVESTKRMEKLRRNYVAVSPAERMLITRHGSTYEHGVMDYGEGQSRKRVTRTGISLPEKQVDRIDENRN